MEETHSVTIDDFSMKIKKKNKINAKIFQYLIFFVRVKEKSLLNNIIESLMYNFMKIWITIKESHPSTLKRFLAKRLKRERRGFAPFHDKQGGQTSLSQSTDHVSREERERVGVVSYRERQMREMGCHHIRDTSLQSHGHLHG